MIVISAKMFKACKNCKALVSREQTTCPVCSGNSFTDEWEGMVILLSDSSELYEVMGVKKPWRYAINIK